MLVYPLISSSSNFIIRIVRNEANCPNYKKVPGWVTECRLDLIVNLYIFILILGPFENCERDILLILLFVFQSFTANQQLAKHGHMKYGY